MENLVIFRQEADAVPLDAAGNLPAASPDKKAWPEQMDADFLNQVGGGRPTSLAVYRRFSLPRTLYDTGSPCRRPDLDGYLLVLLADNELTAGRGLQAETLLDAAYAAFDRHAPVQSERVGHN